MAAGMQTERSRRAGKFHPRFLRRPIALSVIAVMAAGDQVLPCGFPGARARNDVVERQFARGQRLVAILARVPVAHENVLARESTRLMWDAPVFQ